MSFSSECKNKHSQLFRAMQADIRATDGGFSALAKALGMNNGTLSNRFNPDNDAQAPSMGLFLEMLLLTGGERTLRQLCAMNGMTAIPDTDEEQAPEDAIRCFLEFTKEVSGVLSAGAEFASDLRFSQQERDDLYALLLKGLHHWQMLMRAVRS